MGGPDVLLPALLSFITLGELGLRLDVGSCVARGCRSDIGGRDDLYIAPVDFFACVEVSDGRGDRVCSWSGGSGYCKERRE
jgi:hypothetical protein